MRQKEKNYRKTETRRISRNYAKCKAILKETFRNCEINKKYNNRNTNLSNNSLFC